MGRAGVGWACMNELDEIRGQYEAGELDGLRGDLELFIRTHARQIRTLQRERASMMGGDMPDDVAVKLYILRHRTVNPQRDIQDQLREIQRERDDRIARGRRAQDPQQVADEWADEHSAHWRAYRVTSIVYVFERDKERYLRILVETLPRGA